MKESEVIGGFFLPSDEESPKPIHPTVRPFNHPAARLEIRLLLDRLSFFPPSPNMSRESELLQQLSHFAIVIAFIQTEALGLLGRRLRSSEGNCFERFSRQLKVVGVRPGRDNGEGEAVSLDQ